MESLHRSTYLEEINRPGQNGVRVKEVMPRNSRREEVTPCRCGDESDGICEGEGSADNDSYMADECLNMHGVVIRGGGGQRT